MHDLVKGLFRENLKFRLPFWAKSCGMVNIACARLRYPSHHRRHMLFPINLSEKEETMKNLQFNYETLIKVTKSLSKSKDPDEIINMTVESIRSALGIKGCALFLYNPQSKALEVAAS